MKEKVLLHSCCGPCSTACVERLAPDYSITVFFYNPCITDPEEYERRKANQIRFLEERNRRLREAGMPAEDQVAFVGGAYDPGAYFERVRGLEDEPEGGARCRVCFLDRLTAARDYARAHGYPLFTTTLTVSSHKDYRLISSIGKALAAETPEGPAFLDVDFKKKDGFRRSVELSKEYGLYRQDYCGCLFSKRQREEQKRRAAERSAKNV